MEKIVKTIKKHYEIDGVSLLPMTGGWASLAYQLISDKKRFFIKVYEKNRCSTLKLVERIDQYVPMMHWLVDKSDLSGKVALPCQTKDGTYKCEDDDAVYLLYDYIDGRTIGNQSLSGTQVDQLSEIVATLHSFGKEIPFETDAIKEDFHVPFYRLIKDIVQMRIPQMADDLQIMVYPFSNRLSDLANHVSGLADELKDRDIKMALCHTDLHHWNLMQTERQLVLIDWEGLKLAPVEADLFFLIDQPYYERFLKIYQKTHSQFKLNDDTLLFYQGRRKLEDIGEFIEQLLYDPLDQHKRTSIVSSLHNELKTIE